LKFDALLKKALSLDAKYLATGHYARVEKFTNKKSGDTSYLLKKAKDNKKDQSYFLYRLNQNQLKAILFPLGDYTKQEVRKLAGNFALSVADKLASQEICFVPDADYRRFLKTHAKADIKPGLVVDKENNILGEHKGIAFYTIGQREGLGIARGYPIYVTRIDAKNNRIVVGAKEDAYTDEFTLRDTHFVDTFSKKKIAPMVKIRYNHAGAPARIILEKNKMKVKFRQPQFAVTPGQSAVFYDKDTVLGGGIIDKVI
jgi:tRNA-specific 2-thiouridylase